MMKKYWKRLFGLLMTLCMMSTIFVPSAMAGEVTVSDNGAGISVGSGILEDGDDLVSPEAVVVPNGVRIGIQYVYVYPAKHIEGSKTPKFDSSICVKGIYPSAADQSKILWISPEETASLLDRFKAKFGVDADVWYLMARYSIYLDGKGSYGKYFEFDATGDCLSGKTIKKTLNRNDTVFSIAEEFWIPDDTTSRHDIALWGGFYYYSAYAKKDLSSMAGIKVRFNWPDA